MQRRRDVDGGLPLFIPIISQLTKRGAFAIDAATAIAMMRGPHF